MMYVALSSIFFDIILLSILIRKKTGFFSVLRFLCFAAAIEMLVYYVSEGLGNVLGEKTIFYLICATISKLFVLFLYRRIKTTYLKCDVFVYASILILSLCVHNGPAFGVVSSLILIGVLIYFEYLPDKTDDINENDTGNAQNLSANIIMIEDNYRKSRALWHDFNNHIISMRSLYEDKKYDELEKYIDSLSAKLSEAAFPVNSGNVVLDALIADKYQMARKAGIVVDFGKIDYRNVIDAEDLCTILGNVFDNAIEENMRISDKQDMFISLKVLSYEGKLEISMKNPLAHELTVRNGLPATIKPNALHHGIGLRNVRRITDKYNGELIWNCENGVFEIIITLIITQNT